MALFKVPQHNTLTDGQFVQVTGPEGLTTGYRYDEQQRALYFKESQVLFPSFHGASHITEDPVPNATTDTPGLMSEDDKAKLDTLVGTRLGVLGFQGAGFPNDGGWLQGDIILAAGTEFISLERIGNIVRFTVDSPIPLNCSCESCEQIFWVQDETDIISIRPPTCGGKLPGVNSYGEMKIYLFPESTIVDPNNASATLQNKGQYPAFIFKRYDDSIVPGSAEHEMILKRDPNNLLQTEIGWAFTPGAGEIAEMIWFMGKSTDGDQITFKLEGETSPGLLGALLFNGHLITKKMGVIVNYTPTILTNNQYSVKQWNIDQETAVGDAFVAKNVWQYTNPEGTNSGPNPKQIVSDITIDLLPIGTLVDLWAFKIGETSGTPLLRWYFSQKPNLNPTHLWSSVGYHQFGDTVVAKKEVQPSDGSEDKTSYEIISSIKNFERSLWGLTGYDDPVFSYDTISNAGSEGADLSEQHRAVIDTSLPGLKVITNQLEVNYYSERPVWLWNRKNINNALLSLDIGRPNSSNFTPYDIILRAPIDEHENKYMRVIETGEVDGIQYIKIVGVHFHDLPKFGTVRILDGTNTASIRNSIFTYNRKYLFPSDSMSAIALVSADNEPYVGDVGDIIELLHDEYSSPVVRVEFSFNSETELIELQFKVGVLDMSLPYEDDASGDSDDYVRGLTPGYAVSAIYSQTAPFTGIGTQPTSVPDGFVVYDGGMQVGSEQEEYWNRLKIMVKDNQVWIWWNNLLIAPSVTLSANLDTPVTIDTPYFPIPYDVNTQFGKFGCRMWPGSTLRRIDLRSQLTSFSEFTLGQLEVI